MTERKKKSFMSLHYDALLDSFNNLAWGNLVSILCDIGVVLSVLGSALLFNLFFSLGFSDMDAAMLQLMNQPTFFGQAASMVLYLVLSLLSFVLMVVLSALLLGFAWTRLMGKRFDLKTALAYSKQTLAYVFGAFAMVYLMQAIIVDGIWEFIAFFFLIVLLWVLPVIHIRLILSKEGKKMSNILRSLSLFKSNLHHFLVAGVLMFIVVNIITLPVLISPESTSLMASLFYLFLLLVAISWVKTYFIEIVRSIER